MPHSANLLKYRNKEQINVKTPLIQQNEVFLQELWEQRFSLKWSKNIMWHNHIRDYQTRGSTEAHVISIDITYRLVLKKCSKHQS